MSTEGIRDPIKAYEYMNKFYVEEGNKRVSVLKFFGAVSIPGNVIRIVPPRTDEKENRIYYEYMDFYSLSNVNYVCSAMREVSPSCSGWWENGGRDMVRGRQAEFQLRVQPFFG